MAMRCATSVWTECRTFRVPLCVYRIPQRTCGTCFALASPRGYAGLYASPSWARVRVDFATYLPRLPAPVAKGVAPRERTLTGAEEALRNSYLSRCALSHVHVHVTHGQQLSLTRSDHDDLVENNLVFSPLSLLCFALGHNLRGFTTCSHSCFYFSNVDCSPSSMSSESVPGTRKRTRTDGGEDEPPAKRELDKNRSEGVAGESQPQAAGSVQTEGQARDGEKEDEEFWFDDGSVILVARGVKFRVYEGLLAGLSPVFKAMFVERRALRKVRMGEVLALSCLVVHVSDTPEDLRYLLRVCFSRRLGRCVCAWMLLYRHIRGGSHGLGNLSQFV